jgi:Fic family protein
MSYQPPYTLTTAISNLLAEIGESLGRLSVLVEQGDQLRLRRINRIRTIQGSLAIEGNTLSEDQITAILEGKPVIAPAREVQEVRNAILAYEKFKQWQPHRKSDLLKAHQVLMMGLVDDPGRYRSSGVGVMKGDTVVHMAPPADRVNLLMKNLLSWLKNSKEHALISSCVFHYEFEFIHPFSDGNGRMGRLWQTLILSQWKPLFENIPVESMVYANQEGYYKAIRESTQNSDSAPFIEFMLSRILEACIANNSNSTPQVTPQVSPQVQQLISVMKEIDGEANREQLQRALKLSDRKSFRSRYLLPALENGLIEMTLPDKPNSSLQKYRLTALGKKLLAKA